MKASEKLELKYYQTIRQRFGNDKFLAVMVAEAEGRVVSDEPESVGANLAGELVSGLKMGSALTIIQ